MPATKEPLISGSLKKTPTARLFEGFTLPPIPFQIPAEQAQIPAEQAIVEKGETTAWE